ncbi:NAD(P)/FAD-dependent oxidoreductase [Microbacterium sp. RURRCA19A]|uniref:flavin-containing monooxygenase n=1 Tax=Microbacterium sp. RURRCA19A TaxID=1907391 RepID=UPI00095580F4|nr:NAD(P)-binding domain-containing protein [Microbacterium sp. RURRCA19A]SIR95602.1 Predicted flavoprotein CzcO associated with the cation diffusion facilitator CzcD [Microbacterium sp. RURRCA19A]
MSVPLLAPTAQRPVVVIGAGPAGLAAARALSARGIPYVQIERHSDVGGIWDMDNPGSPMYRSAHFISSRDKSGFFDYPMPSHFADYPSREQILTYTRSFAEHYGLRDGIRFETTVQSVTQDERSGEWTVTTDRGEIAASAVICCTGVTWDPQVPEVEGTFDGEIRHSVTYRDASEFRGKRVLIVGLGNSGADIACDAAQNADRAFISTRRGYHFVPKHLLGTPSDQTEWLPIWGERLLYSALAPLVIGDVRRWGLPKPDHKLFETHPLINTQLLHHLQHGDITAKPGISRFDENGVFFTDGSHEDLDLVLFATGYNMSIPYVPQDYLEWKGGRPAMYLNAIAARPGLFGISYIEVNSSAYTLFDRIAHLIASHLDDVRRRPSRARRFRRMVRTEKPDLTGGIRFVGSDRHATYVEVRAYKRELRRVARRMGWEQLTPGTLAESPVATAGALR